MATKNGNYTKSKLNAAKHGITSKSSVLPWESLEELESLKESFIDSFNPAGAGELHLVHELATLAFRKQRVYKAEDALIVRNLSRLGIADMYESSDTVNLLSANLTPKIVHHRLLKEALYTDDEKNKSNIAACEQMNVEYEKQLTKYTDYEECLKNLPVEIYDEWHAYLADDDNLHGKKYEANIDSLKTFIKRHLNELSKEKLTKLKALPYVKSYTTAIAAVPCSQTEVLHRYEVSLNREFEKKLAMLIKLQELRLNTSTTTITV